MMPLTGEQLNDAFEIRLAGEASSDILSGQCMADKPHGTLQHLCHAESVAIKCSFLQQVRLLWLARCQVSCSFTACFKRSLLLGRAC